jgi:hypothetical protein
MSDASAQNTNPYVCEYSHAGQRWELIIHAYDFGDAKARASSLHSVKVKGALVDTIPWQRTPPAEAMDN